MTLRLHDSYGRTIGDLRISVTDRCNFRCGYCIPVENVSFAPAAHLLTDDEVTRLARIAVACGVTKIRVTGGEPLLRPRIERLVARLGAIDGLADLAMTTNGRLLASYAERLYEAGVRRLNISLDSLRPERFAQLTRRDALGHVLDSIAVARRVGFAPIKINAVIIRGVNDDEIADFGRFARTHDLVVRFLEFMPLDSGHVWTRDQVVSGREIQEALAKEFELVPVVPAHPAETARRFRFADGPGEVGIIAPVTNPFCGNCNRMRITADGQLRTCLFSARETDLRTPIRDGASDDDLVALIGSAVYGKERGHRIGKEDFRQPERTMSCIGG